MEKIKVSYLYDDTIANIVLDDGKGNVMDHIMMEDLQNVFDSFSEKKNIKGDEWKNTNQEKQVQPSASRKNAIEQTEKNIPAQTQTLNDTVAIISSRKKP